MSSIPKWDPENDPLMNLTKLIDEEQEPQFEEACRTGNLDEVHSQYMKWLSRQRPHPETGKIKKKPLCGVAYHAAANDQPACLAYFFSNGMKPSMNIAKAAVEAKSTRVLQVLLDYGWDINQAEAYCEPPLLGTVVRDKELVRWFLDHGANPNASASLWEVTPLSYAVARAPLETVRLLFDYGGSVTRGYLVNYATQRPDSECLDILRFLVDQHGAPVDQMLWEDRPDLVHWARIFGTTPLDNAADAGNVEAVRFLLDHGADRNKKGTNFFGEVPLETAISGKHEEIVKLLKEEPTPVLPPPPPPVPAQGSPRAGLLSWLWRS